MLKLNLFFLCLFALFVICVLLSREGTALTLAFSALNGFLCSILIPYEYVACGAFALSLVLLAFTQIMTEILLKISTKHQKERN